MAGRVLMTTVAIAALALAACNGPAATPTPAAPSVPASTAGIASPQGSPVASAPVLASPDASAASASPAPSVSVTSPGATGPAGSLGSPAVLEGVGWLLISISDGSILNPVPDGVRATITLVDGVASGESGCNTFRTPYSLNRNTVEFGLTVSTQKVCDDGTMMLEANYLAALDAVARYGEQQSGMVFFDSPGAPALVYVEAPSGTLQGEWTVTAYLNDRGAIVAPLAGTPVTVAFGDEGSLSGSDGCNSFTGTYEVERVRLTLSGLSGTRAACPSEELSDQEVQFLAALQASTLWNSSETILVLRGQDGIVTLTLERATDG